MKASGLYIFRFSIVYLLSFFAQVHVLVQLL